MVHFSVGVALPMKVLDLFSGIGGFAIAAHWAGFETTQFVEIDPFCQKVLGKNFPGIPIHDDITTFTPAPGQYDIITAGFPCQDISSANPNGRGLEGKRSGLFFRVVDIICVLRPRFVLLENVSALLTARGGRDMGAVLRELSECGYDAEWQLVSASSLGAPHRRNRVFIVAYPQSQRSPWDNTDQGWANVAGECEDSWWRQHEAPEPTICRMDARVSPGLDSRRLKALGNTVTPQQALIPFLRIKELANGQKN